MLMLTEKAKQELLKYNDGEPVVLLTVQPGGCSGLTYDAEIIFYPPYEYRTVYSEDNITVVSDESSIPHLGGLEIDYSDEILASGFKFRNINNYNACNCGASFSTIQENLH